MPDAEARWLTREKGWRGAGELDAGNASKFDGTYWLI
jgi:hypothetical protein